jgi:hypothetical protein
MASIPATSRLPLDADRSVLERETMATVTRRLIPLLIYQ